MHAMIIALMPCLVALAAARLQPGTPAASIAIGQQGEPASLRAGREAFEREDWAAAAGAYQRAIEEGHASPLVHFRLGFSLHVTGEVARALPHHIKAAHITNPALRIDALYNIACAHALMNNSEEALQALQRAIDAGFVDAAQVERDSDLDALRQLPAFNALVATMGEKPGFFGQADGLLGAWVPTDPQTLGAASLNFARQTPGRGPVVCVSGSPAGAASTSLLLADPHARRWRWIGGDTNGTLHVLEGEWVNGAMVFQGQVSCASGPGLFIRRTLRLEDATHLRDFVEASEDAKTWREVRSLLLVRGEEPAERETGSESQK